MSHGDHPDIRDTAVNGIDSPRQQAVEPQKFADAYAMGASLRLVDSDINGRWIQSNTVVEVRR